MTYLPEERETIDTLIEAHFLPKEYIAFTPRFWSYWLESFDDDDSTNDDNHTLASTIPRSTAYSTIEPTSLSSSYLASSSPILSGSRSRQGTEPTILDWKNTGNVSTTTLPTVPSSTSSLSLSPSSSILSLHNTNTNQNNSTIGNSPLLTRSRSSSLSLWFHSSLPRLSSPSLSSSNTSNVQLPVIPSTSTSLTSQKLNYQLLYLKLRVNWLVQNSLHNSSDEEFILNRIGLSNNQKELYYQQWKNEWNITIKPVINSIFDDQYISPHRITPVVNTNNTGENINNPPTCWSWFQTCMS